MSQVHYFYNPELEYVIHLFKIFSKILKMTLRWLIFLCISRFLDGLRKLAEHHDFQFIVLKNCQQFCRCRYMKGVEEAW